MRTLEGCDQVVGRDEVLPDDFDVHCSLLSLPRLVDTTLETIPAAVPYLRSDPELSSRWRERLSTDQFKVGLVWAGRVAPSPWRSIPLHLLAPLKNISGISLVSLQKPTPSPGTPGEGRGEGLTAIPDWTSELTDFAETAALIDNLDLVITVDTAVAHLTGALAKPAWILLEHVPDWRWLLDRSDSPWYPTARLFRQARIGDWETPVRQVVSELESVVRDRQS
jgi:hypothetical protein